MDQKPKRLLQLPEPHRTIFEASVDALLRSEEEGSVELQKIKTEKGVTFSVTSKKKK